ncbi:hypothetical protein [Cohnella sp. CFH 77786]|nr:hypothetical protein [Cohnella sp. CFH 77786]
MAYTCQDCGRESETAHTVTIYDATGVEDRLDVLCPECYEEWLLSIKHG